MILGCDYFNTITENKPIYKHLFTSLLERGHKVYIISAIDRGRRGLREETIRKDKIPSTKVFIVTTKVATDAPYKKYKLAKKLKVDIMIDDRGDICEYFFRRGILALNAFRGLEYLKKTDLEPLAKESN